MEANNQAVAPTEKRSETERHWDIVCLTVVTLGAAILGAIVVFSGISEKGQTDDTITEMDIIVSISVLLAAGLYLLIVLDATRAIFPPTQHRGEKGLAWKRSQALSILALLLTLITWFGIIMLVQTTASVYLPWLKQETTKEAPSTPSICKGQETSGITPKQEIPPGSRNTPYAEQLKKETIPNAESTLGEGGWRPQQDFYFIARITARPASVP